jgi:hypothetical protein
MYKCELKGCFMTTSIPTNSGIIDGFPTAILSTTTDSIYKESSSRHHHLYNYIFSKCKNVK